MDIFRQAAEREFGLQGVVLVQGGRPDGKRPGIRDDGVTAVTVPRCLKG